MGEILGYSYFSSASATSLIFPRLCRLSQYHLAKLETGQRIYREKQNQGELGSPDRSCPQKALTLTTPSDSSSWNLNCAITRLCSERRSTDWLRRTLHSSIKLLSLTKPGLSVARSPA